MSKFQFAAKANKFRSRKNTILETMANNAINHFKGEVFDSSSFDGKKWVPNKVATGSKQLVRTGRLRQGYYIMRRTADSRTIANDVPYFTYHNEGTKNLPKRQLIGESRQLTKINSDYLNKAIAGIV